jgi:Methane oxygenase PmoA
MSWQMASLFNIDKIILKQMHFRKLILSFIIIPQFAAAQQMQVVKLVRADYGKRIDVFIGSHIFTSFLYPDSLEKPVLFPIFDAGNTIVTRGFPRNPRPGEPTDHPHHLGLWFTYESVNGLDFWNNSYAIPSDKKSQYGWIKTDSILEISSGRTGELSYHANWVNQQNQVLLEETTRYVFSGHDEERIIDRITELKADTDILFADAKDGLLGLRLAHELQIPSMTDQQFTDNKGNITKVKRDSVACGNYLTSEGKRGDSAWSTRGIWCKVFGKIGNDSVSITIFDHSGNPGYPTFWHARGYGLFAANPLGEKIFSGGQYSLNLKLKQGDSVLFRYRIYIQNGKSTPAAAFLNQLAKEFDKKY